MEEESLLAPDTRPPIHIYRSAAGEAECHALYDRAVAELPFEHESRLVETSCGTAHVLVCGPASGRPLVLWHGLSVPGPFMMHMFHSLVGDYRLYVPDQPSQVCSRTQPTNFNPAKHEHGKWMLEVLQGLGLAPPARHGAARGDGGAPRPPPQIGVSFGGAALLDLAQVAPEAISSAVLIVPGGLAPVNVVGLLGRVVVPARLYRLLPFLPMLAWLALQAIADEPGLQRSASILAAWRHVREYPRLSGGQHGFRPDQLAKLASPTLVAAAERDIFFSGPGSLRAARAAMPRVQTHLIPGAKHLPSQPRVAALMARIRSFLQEQGYGPQRGRL